MRLKCDNTTTFELKLVIMESKNLNSNCWEQWWMILTILGARTQGYGLNSIQRPN